MADKSSSTDTPPRRVTRRSAAIAEEPPAKIQKTLPASEGVEEETVQTVEIDANKNGDESSNYTEINNDNQIDSNTCEMIDEISDLLESGNENITETSNGITEDKESSENTVESTDETNTVDVNDKSVADNNSKDDKVPTELSEAVDVPNKSSDAEKVSTETSELGKELSNTQPANVTNLDDDTEVVSEDELPPPPTKEKVDGAEEVSDEELPAAPKPDLPPEAEDVSDDELVEPLEKRKKLEIKKKPGTDRKKTSQENSNKPDAAKETKVNNGKRPREDDSSSQPTASEEVTKKPREISPEKKLKKLPELQKYWKTVKDNPADFTGWTYLLQYVDQESDVEAAEEAYSAFLALYPYCYGYWRKYADYEKKKGTKAKCEEIGQTMGQLRQVGDLSERAGQSL
uniref:Pre-mRNA-processing factor 39 n=1 Tax=Cacopsylla melanoneura TaxID=428564 RepID=A0A8D8WCR0_9HEMI